MKRRYRKADYNLVYLGEFKIEYKIDIEDESRECKAFVGDYKLDDFTCSFDKLSPFDGYYGETNVSSVVIKITDNNNAARLWRIY